MLNLLKTCFPERMAQWEPELARLMPSYGIHLNDDRALADSTLADTAEALEITR